MKGNAFIRLSLESFLPSHHLYGFSLSLSFAPYPYSLFFLFLDIQISLFFFFLVQLSRSLSITLFSSLYLPIHISLFFLFLFILTHYFHQNLESNSLTQFVSNELLYSPKWVKKTLSFCMLLKRGRGTV